MWTGIISPFGDNSAFLNQQGLWIPISSAVSQPLGQVVYGTGSGLTSSPNLIFTGTELDILGKTKTTNFQLTSGAVNNYILQSDASGNGTWVAVSSIIPTTTVSNTSSVNSLTTTVNTITSSAVNIINSNALTQSGASITSSLNGVSASVSPSLTGDVSGNLNSTSVDKIKSTPVVITSLVNTDILQYNGTNWVNVLPASIIPSTTNVLSLSTNILTSTVNGITATANSVSGVSNSSSTNTLTTTVNGIIGTSVNIVNSNSITQSGASITSAVNGVTSSVSPAITGDVSGNLNSTSVDKLKGKSLVITSLVNNDILKYNGTNWINVASSSIIPSTTNTLSLSGNTLTSTVNGVVATSNSVSGVSNTSSTNSLSTTVNGVTSTTVPIINTNVLSLSGNNLTSSINGIASSAQSLSSLGLTGDANGSLSATTVDKLKGVSMVFTSLATNNLIQYNGTNWVNVTPSSIIPTTTNTLSLSTNTLTSTVNGTVATSNAVSGVSNTSSVNNLSTTVNGVTGSNVNIINSVSNSSSTNTLTTTINGVAGTGVNLVNSNAVAWTQAGGLSNTTNGVAATLGIASGTIAQSIGYNASGVVVYGTAGGSTSPGGSNTQVQYNNSGAFGGSANFTFDGTTTVLKAVASTSASIPFKVVDSSSNNILYIQGDTNVNIGTATATSSLLYLKKNFGAAHDNFTIANGEFGNILFRIRDNKTSVASTIGTIFFGSMVQDQTNPTTEQFDIGGYGLGTTYGDGTLNSVLLNNNGNVGDGQGTIVMAKASNFYVNQQTTKQFKIDSKGNFGFNQLTFGTSSQGVLAVATTTAPSTSPSGCFQMYSSLRGGTSAKNGLTVRAEDGTQHILSDFSGIGTTSPTSTLSVNGSISGAYVSKTGTYTVTASDYAIEATSGTFTITLPTAIGITGRMYIITNSGSGIVTLGTTSSQTFVNVATTPTTLSLVQYTCVTIMSNGANWIRTANI